MMLFVIPLTVIALAVVTYSTFIRQRTPGAA